jgi:uncharacterized protein YegL
MSGSKINILNLAIKDAIPHMQRVANDNPYADVLVRAIQFSSGAQWRIAHPTQVALFTWTDLTADGVTDMGRALTMVADQLKIPPMTERALPPVLVLVSDGQPTDDFNAGLRALMEQPWGKKAVRIAIAIGDDADIEVLQKFIGNPEIKPLLANSPELLVRYIKWVSTAVLASATAPPSQRAPGGAAPSSNVPIPAPPDPGVGPASAGDVW